MKLKTFFVRLFAGILPLIADLLSIFLPDDSDHGLD